MKNFKNNKGITLVALIITIIVLLILAVVAISEVNGDGIITKAKIARENYQTAQEEENLALAEYQTTLDSINNEGSGSRENSPSGDTTKKWTLTDSDSSGSITVGDLITNKEKTTEQFYVIEDLGSGDTVKMLAKYNLKSDGSAQDTTGADNECTFASTNYWSNETNYPLDLNNCEIPLTETSVITIAKEYGKSLGVETGRLMILEEIESLGGSKSTESTANCTGTKAFINTQRYWLGTAENNGFVPNPEPLSVWYVYGDGTSLSLGICDGGDTHGVRPVLEISASTIE